jgi:hypothetical protein
MGHSTFLECRSLENVVLSEQLTRLDDYTFRGCEALRRIEIPTSVTSIGRHIFTGCDMLRTVVIHGDGDITFDRVQMFPNYVRFYTNSPTVTAYLIENRPGSVFPKEAAPPVNA